MGAPKNVNVNKGWFQVPGIRGHGDRTIEEQMLGLDRALAEAKGATVLDLGCAEGAISLAFAQAGARRVYGLEVLETHLAVARRLCAGWIQVQFQQADLRHWTDGHPEPEEFDIVLALGIVHKMRDPAKLLRWAAMSSRRLLCFRAPAQVEREGEDYYVKAKHYGKRVNVPGTMREMGFVDEGTIAGTRGEGVQYWRRA